MSTASRALHRTAFLRSSLLPKRNISASYCLASRSKPVSAFYPSVRASFSTMSPLQSGAPAPTGPQKYDTEISDMASYIHNYKIDSELAVSQLSLGLKCVLV
jgi:2-methylcitrate dehydratase